MTKAPINTFDRAVLSLEYYYAGISDPTGHDWPYDMAMAFLGLCSLNYTNKPRAQTMAACIMLTLPLERRQQIESQFVVASEVYDAMAEMGTTPVWPQPLTLGQWADPSEDDLDKFKAGRINALSTQIDMAANAVIQTSPRALLTQMWSGLSAICILNGLVPNSAINPSDAPDAANFPLVGSFQARNALPDLEAAADGLMQRGIAWATADNALQQILAGATDAINGAVDMDAVQAAFDAGVGQVNTVITQLMGPAEEPETPEE